MVLRFSIVIILATVLLLTACTGASGPAGSSGPSGPAGPAGPPAAEVSPAKIVITPMSGLPKAKLTIYGSGFKSEEKVRVILSLEGFDLAWGGSGTGGFVTANEYGAFVLKPRGGIPALGVVQPGVFAVNAIGDKGSSATSPLEVLEKK